MVKVPHGRLLFDTKSILADTLTQIDRTSKKRGLDVVDLSLLTDGLQAEREQGITIDVAYRYFSTGTRKYIIADAPGHEQYTRNMVTAASTANLAIILIDARKGVLTQTRRHSFLAHLVGIPHIVVAINKMDLVSFNQATFEKIKADYLSFAEQIGLQRAGRDIQVVPLSALTGDMLVDRGDAMSWYQAQPCWIFSESSPAAHSEQHADHFASLFSSFAAHASVDKTARTWLYGRVEPGEIAVGDAVTVLRKWLHLKSQSHSIG